jgi:flagellar basal-body rod modification protein FlgD
MPNAIPPTAPVTTPSLTDSLLRQGSVGPGGKLGKDEFLRLLTTQLRYQDPMNPMDGHQLAADLAQFSGLEQLLNMNDAMAAQVARQDVMLSAINNSVAINTIGKTIHAEGDQIMLADDGSGTVDGTIIADVATEGNATLEILDASGAVVGTLALGYVKAGDGQSFQAGAAAAGLQPGLYRARVSVIDGSGSPVPQATYFTGVVDGLSYSPTGAVLTSGPVEVSIGTIRRIIG